MNCTVRYSNGDPDDEFASIQLAVAALRADDASLLIEDAAGFEHDEDDEDDAYDVRGDEAARVYDGDDCVAVIEAIIARFGDTLYHTGPEVGCGSAWVVAL